MKTKTQEPRKYTSYKPSEIEGKWQKKWQEKEIYQAVDFSKKPKFYILIEFPYPSGAGLHVGHARSWSAMDAYARKKRMEGYNVLYPIGWDAFGLPAENYALKTGLHPSKTVAENISHFKEQCQSLGLSFDWRREINTTDPEYYKWTQWIFLKLLENGLAYRDKVPVNWCESCKTTLADEEVLADGSHERCGQPTERRLQEQWLLKITKYGQGLLDDLNLVDYSPKIRIQQENWIGRSEGANIKFKIQNPKVLAEGRRVAGGLESKINEIEVFTTRPDTIFGATAVVVAPEHPIVAALQNVRLRRRFLRQRRTNPKSKWAEISKYVEQAKKKSELERTGLAKEKTGVFTGLFCLNPLNDQPIPLWVGDYIVASYGGGAVMLVPAHDYRDYDFAKKYGLEIKEVIEGRDITKEANVNYGTLINSGEFNGLDSRAAIKKITAWLEKRGLGKKTVTYRLRDWVFSRQHYWGEPIPIVYCEKCGIVPVPEGQLPVELPYVEKYEPSGTGESPLAKITDWVNTKCPQCAGPAKRETDTMPNWAGSNWYFLRYLDNKNDQALASRQKMEYWLPVDIYQGGFEHTTLHLLYSRFIYKFLYDIGAVPAPEPYLKRRSHGIVLGPDNRKMSKSFGNVVNPDDIVLKYGADTLRLYEMFMGPFDQEIAWSEQNLAGCYRFLERVWRLFQNNLSEETPPSVVKKLHQTIKKVGEDIEGLKFNTMVSAMMEFINDWGKSFLSKKDAELFIKILAVSAPHLAEEIWTGILGNDFSVHQQPWPKYDEALIQEENITLVIQINGKVRDRVLAEKDISEKRATEIALAREKVNQWLKGKNIKKVIFVPGKLINIVI